MQHSTARLDLQGTQTSTGGPLEALGVVLVRSSLPQQGLCWLLGLPGGSRPEAERLKDLCPEVLGGTAVVIS